MTLTIVIASALMLSLAANIVLWTNYDRLEARFLRWDSSLKDEAAKASSLGRMMRFRPEQLEQSFPGITMEGGVDDYKRKVGPHPALLRPSQREHLG